MKKRVIIIMGVQRSGTTALFETLATDPDVTAYHEHPDDALYYDYYLRPEPEIRALLHAAPGAVLLKPVKESNKRGVEAVFEEYAAYDLRIIWLYRDPVNVIYSWVGKGWTTMSNAINVALEWTARNQAMLEMLSAFKDRLIVVRYEDLLQNTGVLEALKASVGLTGQSTLRTDSNAGRANVPEGLQALIDQITGRTLALLDQARTLRPCVAEEQAHSSSFAGLLQRFGVKRSWERSVVAQPASSIAPSPLPGEEAFLLQPDLYTQAYNCDPYACFRVWRQQGTVVPLPAPKSWLVLGYEAVAQAAREKDHFAAPPGLPPDVEENNAWEPTLTAFLAPQNYPHQLARTERSIRTLLTAQPDGGTFDWMEVCRQWIPRVFANLLGVLPGCSDTFYKLVNQQATLEAIRATLDDTGLLATLIDGGRPSRQNLSEFIFLVSIFPYLISQFLGSSVYLLLQQPEWATRIKTHPEKLPALISELLRLLPPVLHVVRTTRCAVEIGGNPIPAGSFVYLSVGAANRDPNLFEQPDALRLERASSPLLPFSFSSDSCRRLGEHMIRLISEAVLRVLLTEFPPLETAQPLSSTDFKYSAFLVSGPTTLPVKFAAAKSSELT